MSVNQNKVLKKRHPTKLNRHVPPVKGPQGAQRATVKKSFSRNPSIVS